MCNINAAPSTCNSPWEVSSFWRPIQTNFGPCVIHEARPESGQLHSTFFCHRFDCVCGCLVESFIKLISLCSSGIYASIFEAGCMPSLQLGCRIVYSKYRSCRWVALSLSKPTDMGG